MRTDLPPAFFLTDGDHHVATALCRGPWDDASCHGGPVAALIGREVERADADQELSTVRLTIELLRPVPIAALRVETTVLRPGKRVRILGVSVTHDGTEVARASALRVRRTPDDVPASRPGDGDRPFGPPEDAEPIAPLVPQWVGITDAVDVLLVAGSVVEPGPATCWFRMTAPLVDDEAISPLSTALVAADFGNGISNVVSIERHLYINPDLTVYLHRPPTGEWIANDAVTWLHPGAGSIAEAALWDADGQVGRATQSLYVAAR